MRKKDEFMSIASHELKTPVTSLKGSLQIPQRIARKSGRPLLKPVSPQPLILLEAM
ncbi:histidine kinase dimerization/phospho-acceptor domain-containing protein [Mucilaginibacter gossypiicola]|jgi:signal transduction histidine kinase|uniref:histidine kinase dimerization/phospho-acceptor domain-containing protein n=1 Tax=Mucilaginibacter gossypiicola TaxID=551995 RepID=UPI00142F4F0C|nr:histidine kinase dimerization/phospho-acceptor domain-containing protein [Mucilaginibacter gossypiicola]